MIWTIINVLAILWITYRVVIARQFLLWDWSGEKTRYVWQEDDHGNGNR